MSLPSPHFSLHQKKYPLTGRVIRHDGMTVKLLTFDETRRIWRAIVCRGDVNKIARRGDYVYILDHEIGTGTSLKSHPQAIPV